MGILKRSRTIVEGDPIKLLSVESLGSFGDIYIYIHMYIYIYVYIYIYTYLPTCSGCISPGSISRYSVLVHVILPYPSALNLKPHPVFYLLLGRDQEETT